MLDKLLKKVEKPIRYTGGEINMCKKDISKIKSRIAFCFPDVYEIGMSHLGMKILYDLYNRKSDTYYRNYIFSYLYIRYDFLLHNCL